MDKHYLHDKETNCSPSGWETPQVLNCHCHRDGERGSYSYEEKATLKTLISWNPALGTVIGEENDEETLNGEETLT
jgi:hypothetical protein